MPRTKDCVCEIAETAIEIKEVRSQVETKRALKDIDQNGPGKIAGPCLRGAPNAKKSGGGHDRLDTSLKCQEDRTRIGGGLDSSDPWDVYWRDGYYAGASSSTS